MRCLARRLEGLGQHHRDDLAAMLDPVGAERHDRRADIAAVAEQFGRLDRVADIGVGQDVEHAGGGPAGAVVDPGDPAAGNRARREKGIGRVGERRVRGVVRLAGDFEAAVDARRRGPDLHYLCHDQMLSWAA